MEQSLISTPPNTGTVQGRWTPEQDAVLRHGRANGKSSSEIAAILGTKRNAVIGRAHRLGLERLAPCNAASRQSGHQKSSPKLRKLLPRLPTSINLSAARPVQTQYLDKNLADLTDRECHFIARDHSLYCGVPIKADSKLPYCEYCRSIMYQPQHLRGGIR